MSKSEEAETVPEELGALGVGAGEISYRIWFGAFIVFLALITLLFHYQVIEPGYAVLAGFIAYMMIRVPRGVFVISAPPNPDRLNSFSRKSWISNWRIESLMKFLTMDMAFTLYFFSQQFYVTEVLMVGG